MELDLWLCQPHVSVDRSHNLHVAVLEWGNRSCSRSTIRYLIRVRAQALRSRSREATYVRTYVARRGVDRYARVIMASTFPCPIENPISHPTESLLLHDATAKGHLDTTKLLVKKKGQGPNDSDKDGNAPLHHAACNGRLETVAFLAKHSDPDIRGNLGWTPLHFACLEGHLEVAKHLVEVCRASVSAEDEKGRNAAHFAAYSGNLELICFLAQEKGLESG